MADRNVTMQIYDGSTTWDNLYPNTKWANISDKPGTFTPSTHTHAIADITGLQTALNGAITLSGTQTITGTKTISGVDLHMDGGSVNYVRPATTSGWARGFWWSKRSTDEGGATRIGGIGVLGSNQTVSKFYVGFGESPWSGSAMEIFPTYANINGHKAATETWVNNNILQSDWAQTNTSAKDYIKNKPAIIPEATSNNLMYGRKNGAWHQITPNEISGLDVLLDAKVNSNIAITGATNTKITYDSKGLVTGGTSLSHTDIPNLNASKINDGTFAIGRIPTGTSGSTVALGNHTHSQYLTNLSGAVLTTTNQTVAGDKTFTGQTRLNSGSIPFYVNRQNNSAGVYAGAMFEKGTSGTAGVANEGIGFYFKSRDAVGNMDHAGIVGGRLAVVTGGSEVGELIMGPAYANVDPYQRADFRIRARNASTADVYLNGDMYTGAPITGTGGNKVATEAFVNANYIQSETDPTVRAWAKISDTSAVTVNKGGTGLTSIPSGNLLRGNGTGNVVALAGTEVGQILVWDGSQWIAQQRNGVTSTTSNVLLNSASQFNQYIRVNSSSARTVTVEPDSTINAPIGTEYHIEKMGTGTLTIQGGSGVSLLSANNPKTIPIQYGVATIKKVAGNTWTVFGALS